MERLKKYAFSGSTAYLHQLLLRIRPSELTDIIKKIVRISRREIQTSQGQTFWIDPVSHFGQEIIQTQSYEPQMTQILGTLLRPRDTFVDVGANEGYFSVVASALVKEGRVFSIEPQSRLKDILFRNRELNGCANISIHILALSDRVGSIPLYLRPTTNTGSSSLFDHTRIRGKKEEVPTTTLSRFLSQNQIEKIRLLKIDCEGAEDLVVMNGQEIFQKQQVDFIALEYHHAIRGKEKLDKVHGFLESCGYQLVSIKNQSIYHLKRLRNEIDSVMSHL